MKKNRKKFEVATEAYDEDDPGLLVNILGEMSEEEQAMASEWLEVLGQDDSDQRT